MLRRRWGVAVVAVAVLAGAGAWYASGRAEHHLRAAERAVDAGESAEALGWLAVPEATAATRDRARLLRARVAVERNDLKGAVRALDGVDPHGPAAAGLAYWKGRTLYAAGQPWLALAWLDRAAQLRPDDADAARWRAAAAYDLGDRGKAVAALEAVTRLDPRDARAWRTLGLVAKENVDYELARDAFRRTLALDRAQPEARLDLAECLVKLGSLDDAERELEGCRGKVAEGRRSELVAECRRLAGDRDGHRAAVDAGLAAAPDRPGLLAARAQIDLLDGRPGPALAWLDRAAAADPHRAETFYQRGLIHRRLGHDAEARADSERAAALTRQLAAMSALNDEAAAHPDDPAVRCKLGRACLDLGKPELAASWYRAALACDPNNDEARQALARLPDARPGRGPTR